MKSFRKFLALATLLLVSVALGFSLLFLIPGVQNWTVRKLTEYISKKIHTEVTIQNVSFHFPTDLTVHGLLIQDTSQDTLLYCREMNIQFSLFSILRREIKLSRITFDKSYFSYKNNASGTLNSFSFLKINQPTATPPSKKSPKTNWRFLLGEITLTQTEIRIEDQKTKNDIQIFLPHSTIACNGMNLSAPQKKINALTIRYPLLIWQKKGDALSEDTAVFRQFLPPGMELIVEKLSILNGAVRYNPKLANNSANSIVYNQNAFNKNIQISNLSADIDSIRLQHQSLTASINTISAREQSGIRIDKLSGMISFNQNLLALRSLNIRTPSSRINGNIQLRYNHFNDLKYFTQKVNIQANVKDCEVNTRDIAPLNAKWKNIPQERIKLSGLITGKMGMLRGKNLSLETGKGTFFKGECCISGLPDIKQTQINLSVKQAGTIMTDLQRWIPNVSVPQNLYSLGQIRFKGEMSGIWNDLQAKGVFQTNLGYLETDVHLHIDKKTGKSAYKGYLALQQFELGTFFSIPQQAGQVSMNINIDGKGVTLESLDAHVSGEIVNAEIKGYPYRNTSITGNVVKKSFTGTLVFNDENLKGMFTGIADWQNNIPEYNFDAEITHSDFRNMRLLKSGNLNFSGKVNGHFSGKSISDFKGSVNARNFTFVRNDSLSFTLEEIDLHSEIDENDMRQTSLRSDVLDIDIAGKFNYSSLIPSMKALALSVIYKDSLMPAKAYANQFIFNVKTYNPDQISKLIHPKLRLTGNAHFRGEVNTETRELHLMGEIPEISFDSYRIKQLSLNGDYTPVGFHTDITLNDFYIKDSLMVDTLSISALRRDQEIICQLKTANPKGNNSARLDVRIRPGSDHALVFIDPSEVIINHKRWSFSPNNSILVQGKRITTQNLIFSSDISSIYFNAYVKNDTSTVTQINLSQTNLGDLLGLFLPKKPELQGFINGKIVVENIFGKPEFTGDLVVEELKLGKEKIGDVALSSYLDAINNRIVLDASIKSTENEIYANGYMSLIPGQSKWGSDILIKKWGLNFLNYSFFERYVKNVNGWANGKLHLGNEKGKLGLTGKLLIQDANCTVTYTNVRYHLENEEVNLGDGFFDLGTIIGKDAKGNILVGSGKIFHDNLKYYTLDLKVSTDNGHFLNTTEKENPTFYGSVYGSGYVSFTGSTKTPLIRGYTKTLPGTHCYLPIRDVYETNRYSFFRFEDPRTDTAKGKKQEIVKISGVTFILDLDITPDATMEIILDPVAGDKLVGNGKGNLKIEIQRTGDINLYGQYEIERGNYMFTLQNVISKPFQLERGGTVQFSGSIYKALLNANASYSLRTSTYDLIADLITDPVTGQITNKQLEALSKNIIPVKLLLALKGPLEKPGISFDVMPVIVDPALKQSLDIKMQLIRNTDSELNKQVFGLLVMNRFLPSSLSATGALGNSSLLGGSVASTLSEFLSNQFSLYANNLLSNFVEGMNINIGYRQYNESNNNVNGNGNGSNVNTNSYDSRNAVQVALSKYFLKNRLSISAGGNVDFGSSTSSDSLGTSTRSQNAVFAGDFQIEYSITPNGSWRARAYNRTDFNNYNNRNNNRTGLGITYRKEFDNWWDFIGKKNRIKKTEKINQENKGPETKK